MAKARKAKTENSPSATIERIDMMHTIVVADGDKTKFSAVEANDLIDKVGTGAGTYTFFDAAGETMIVVERAQVN